MREMKGILNRVLESWRIRHIQDHMQEIRSFRHARARPTQSRNYCFNKLKQYARKLEDKHNEWHRVHGPKPILPNFASNGVYFKPMRNLYEGFETLFNHGGQLGKIRKTKPFLQELSRQRRFREMSDAEIYEILDKLHQFKHLKLMASMKRVFKLHLTPSGQQKIARRGRVFMLHSNRHLHYRCKLGSASHNRVDRILARTKKPVETKAPAVTSFAQLNPVHLPIFPQARVVPRSYLPLASFPHLPPIRSVDFARAFTSAAVRRNVQTIAPSDHFAKLCSYLHIDRITALLRLPNVSKSVDAVIRLSLSLFPLSARVRWIHLKRLTPARFYNSKAFMLSLLVLPVALLSAVLLSHVQTTPITGRRRIIFLSDAERQALIAGLTASDPNQLNEVQWYHILRSVLGEATAPAGVLLGGNVLQPGTDAREIWVRQTLDLLEAGLANASSEISIDGLTIPSTAWPLHADGSRKPYTLLLVDRPESNAFSFGFGPNEGSSSSPGVIVVFTGLLQSILGTTQLENATPEQTRQLSVVLSHELGHLALEHTLESYSNGSLVFPQLRRICIDVARSFLWPVTAMLGPFFNDSIFMSSSLLSQAPNTATPDTWLETLRTSCESQAMETEADLTGLRLLASAHIDPREALVYWQARLGSQSSPDLRQPSQGRQLRLHAAHSADDTLTSSHPVDQARVAAIERQLRDWSPSL